MISLIIIFLGAILLLFLGLNKSEKGSRFGSLLILSIAFSTTILEIVSIIKKLDLGKLGQQYQSFISDGSVSSMIFFSNASLLISAVLIFGTFLVLLLMPAEDRLGADLPAIVLFSLCGALILTAYTHLLMLFLGIEIMSIPLYVLAGSRKNDLRSNEAALKYFLMGAFSTAIFLLGCVLVYASSEGYLNLYEIRNASGNSLLIDHVMGNKLKIAGYLLLCSAMLFKAGAVPFHFWAPDVYQGSPNRGTLFMSTVPKVASIFAMLNLFVVFFGANQNSIFWLIVISSGASILLGNIAALRQTDAKRMLAYSSIAHSGYMLFAVVGNKYDSGFIALFIYAIAYILSASILFFVLDKLKNSDGTTSIEAFSKISKNNSEIVFAVVIALLSMAGIPITAGFIGKYSLFNTISSSHIFLLIVALVGSAIGIAYYFGIFKAMFYGNKISSQGEGSIRFSGAERVVLLLISLTILALGIIPNLLTGFLI